MDILVKNVFNSDQLNLIRSAVHLSNLGEYRSTRLRANSLYNFVQPCPYVGEFTQVMYAF